MVSDYNFEFINSYRIGASYVNFPIYVYVILLETKSWNIILIYWNEFLKYNFEFGVLVGVWFAKLYYVHFPIYVYVILLERVPEM